MSTTQILFNSPALHSLKRDQLVKLCKIHSIKASGKNTDLVEKLKQHALSLQQAEQEADGTGDVNNDMDGVEATTDARLELSQEVENHDGSNAPDRCQMPRPSEQWEVVMDSIDEEEEGSFQNTVSSKGTLRTIGGSGNTTLAGEFGTGGSKSELQLHRPQWSKHSIVLLPVFVLLCSFINVHFTQSICDFAWPQPYEGRARAIRCQYVGHFICLDTF